MFDPRRTDIRTMECIRKSMSSEQLDTAEEDGLFDLLKSAGLHPEKVLVHGKHGAYYAIRNKKGAQPEGAAAEHPKPVNPYARFKEIQARKKTEASKKTEAPKKAEAAKKTAPAKKAAAGTKSESAKKAKPKTQTAAKSDPKPKTGKKSKSDTISVQEKKTDAAKPSLNAEIGKYLEAYEAKCALFKKKAMAAADRKFLESSPETQEAFLKAIHRQEEDLHKRHATEDQTAVYRVAWAMDVVTERRRLNDVVRAAEPVLKNPAMAPMEKYHAIADIGKKKGIRPLPLSLVQDIQKQLGIAAEQAVTAGRIDGPHTREQDLAAANPLYKSEYIKKKNRGYGENCQYCVCAYEARRRGYDVEARPIAVTKSGTNFDAWDRTAFDGGQVERVDGVTGKKRLEEVCAKMAAWGDGARAFVDGVWSHNKTHGHVFVAEQRDGKTYFMDPQNNNQDVTAYFSKMKSGTMHIMRVDNLEFNISVNQMLAERKG